MAEESRGAGCLGRMLFVGILIIILRANLPPNNVAQSLDLGGKSGIKDFFTKLAASEFVADWEYMYSVLAGATPRCWARPVVVFDLPDADAVRADGLRAPRADR
jgi:hypothetical protein